MYSNASASAMFLPSRPITASFQLVIQLFRSGRVRHRVVRARRRADWKNKKSAIDTTRQESPCAARAGVSWFTMKSRTISSCRIKPTQANVCRQRHAASEKYSGLTSVFVERMIRQFEQGTDIAQSPPLAEQRRRIEHLLVCDDASARSVPAVVE